MELYPLQFEPVLKDVLWGGRRLARLGKALPTGARIGESWEVVDLPGESGVVAAGPLRGRTLHDLLDEGEAEVLGPVPRVFGRFPLLVKFIDAADRLSVQVHPDEATCSLLGEGARPKSEAWFILDAEPGAFLYLGLREGVDARTLAESLDRGEVEDLLCRVPVRPGMFVSVPAGTVHAIGRGVLLCEVQQMSDTTYRVWDFGRLDPAGRPRPLHVREALCSIAFERPGPPPVVPPASGRPGVAGPHFVMERQSGPADLAARGPLILVGIEGRGRVVGGAGPAVALVPGRTLLVPAALGGCRVEPDPGPELAYLSISVPVDA